MRRLHFLNSRDFWLALVIAALALVSVYMFNANRSLTHRSRVENCRAVNELRREIFVAEIDLGVDRTIAQRFLPSDTCGDLP